MPRLTIVCIIALSLASCASAPPTNLDSAVARCGLLSKDPLQPAQVNFSNTSAEPLSLYWASPLTNDLIHYRDLPAGQSFLQSTYVGHLWVAKTSRGKIASTFCTASSADAVDLGHSPAG